MQPGIGQDPRPRGDLNMIALLSLKLLLLGLFILLNALSQYEQDRSRRVIESVNEAFNGRVQAQRSYVDHSAGLGPLDEAATSLDTIGRLFQSVAPVVRREPTREGQRLWLELPAHALFETSSDTLRAGRLHLLGRFAEALAANRDRRVAIRVELLHGITRNGYASLAAAGPTGLEPRRVGALARRLVSLGLEPGWLSIGLLPGLEGRLRLVVELSDGFGASSPGEQGTP